MRPIGFSTGALAGGDFERGLETVHRHGLNVVELSALPQNELIPLLDAIPQFDLQAFRYISVHAPSWFEPADEAELCIRLWGVAHRGWPIVVHPDVITDFGRWREFRGAICIEKYGQEKANWPLGR